jgi:hypothetical protein
LPKRSAEHRPGKFEWEINFEPGRRPAFQIMPLSEFSDRQFQMRDAVPAAWAK